MPQLNGTVKTQTALATTIGAAILSWFLSSAVPDILKYQGSFSEFRRQIDRRVDALEATGIAHNREYFELREDLSLLNLKITTLNSKVNALMRAGGLNPDEYSNIKE